MAKSAILDRFGTPYDLPALGEEVAGPTVTGVRQPLSDHPAVGLTPQRLAGLLRAAEEGDPIGYLELAEDIEERDPHYLGVLGTRKRSVCQLEITVEAASDDKDDVVAADLVRDWLTRDGIEDGLFDLMDAIGKGYAFVEIIWDMSERQWQPARLEWRDPRWFEFDRRDMRTPMLRGEAGPQPLPAGKVIHHTHKAKSGLPVRSGLARPMAWLYMIKHWGMKDWVTFAEVYGQPLRLGKYGPGATQKDIATLLSALRNLGSDAAAVIPQSMVVEFVKAEGGTSGSAVYKDLLTYTDQQISKLVLGQTATTDAIAGGHAVGQEHRQVQEDIERSDAKQVAATLNAQPVRWLVDLNMGPRQRYPRVRIGRKDQVDIPMMTGALKDLVPLGLRVGMSTVRDLIGLPDPGQGEEVLTAPGAAQAGGGAAAPAGPPSPPAKSPTAPPALAAALPPVLPAAPESRDAIDTAVDSLLSDYEPLTDPIVEAVLATASAATGFDDFLARLSAIAGDLPVSALADTVARTGFAAGIAGRLGVPLSEREGAP